VHNDGEEHKQGGRDGDRKEGGRDGDSKNGEMKNKYIRMFMDMFAKFDNQAEFILD